MYGDSNTYFQATNFQEFVDVDANTTCKISQDWAINLNDGIGHLACQIMG